MSKRKKKTVNYIDNEEFLNAIIDYKQKCKEATLSGKPVPRIPDYIGSCIFKIAQGLASKPCYSNYSFLEEMIGDAIENSILYFHNFNPEYKPNPKLPDGTDNPNYNPNYKPNPFSYFSQIASYAFHKRIYKEERTRCATYKHFIETMGVHHDAEMFEDESGAKFNPHALYENLAEAIDTFDKKEEEKRAKKRSQKKNSLQDLYVEEEGYE